MPNLTLPVRLFRPVLRAAEAGAGCHPLDPAVVDAMLAEIRMAGILAFAPAVEAQEVTISLSDAGLEAFGMCFEVGAETDGAIADEDWTAIIQATGAVSAKATTLRAMC
jgi:hypothetical protein